MITDTDIKKLKGVFATKTDLKRFTTKTDLKRFATKTDLKKFATKKDLENFATKAQFKELDERTIRIAEKVSAMDMRMDNFATKEDLENGLRQTTDVLLTAMDKIAQGMDVMKHEYTAIGLQSDRHINDKNVHLNPIRS